MFSLILVDFNSLPKTLEYIDRCVQAFGAEGSSHVVIIQNGDPSLDIPMLAQAYDGYTSFISAAANKEVLRFSYEGQEILYCASGENLGYAKGNNLGVKIAAEMWADEYCIISNNDLEYPNGFDLQKIVNLFVTHQEIGAIGPQIVTPEGEYQSPRRFESAFSRLVRFYWLPLLTRPFGASAVERARKRTYADATGDRITGNCDWVSGCLTFLRASAFVQAGMYDENTFLYAEEMILARRLTNVGAAVYYCDDVAAVHAHGGTTKKNITNLKMTKIDFGSNYYFYRTYTDSPRIILWFAKLCFSALMTMCKVKSWLKAVMHKAG